MKTIFLLGLLAFVICVRADDNFKAFNEEVKRQEHTVKGKNISELAHDFVAETKALGKEIAGFFRETVAKVSSHGNGTSHRGARSLDNEEEWSIHDLLSEISKLTSSERESRADEKPAEADPAANEVATADTKDGAPASSYQTPSPTYAPPAQTYAPPTYAPPTTTSSYTSSYNKKKKGGAIVAPAPILIPIPGPPGAPGPPGLPGLPGLPGKTPSLRGLKAILLAKIAKLWLLAKAVALLCLGMFGGNLGLILGLVLPLYGKLKKAGVVLPVQQKEYEQPSYGYEQPAYQPEPSYAAPAPVSDSYIAPVANQVHAAIDQGQSAYGAPPPPPYPAQRRRR